MSFWSKIGDTFKSVGKGIVSMIPGFAISTASNAIGGAMSAKDAKRQHKYDLEKMAKQHGYNIESQKLGQQFNKEMWDYTSIVTGKHLEAAGLNPALLYGMSGGGGATAAGAQGMPAGIASGHEMGIKQQGRGMGLQAAAIASQIDLNNSQVYNVFVFLFPIVQKLEFFYDFLLFFLNSHGTKIKIYPFNLQ